MNQLSHGPKEWKVYVRMDKGWWEEVISCQSERERERERMKTEELVTDGGEVNK